MTENYTIEATFNPVEGKSDEETLSYIRGQVRERFEDFLGSDKFITYMKEIKNLKIVCKFEKREL